MGIRYKRTEQNVQAKEVHYQHDSRSHSIENNTENSKSFIDPKVNFHCWVNIHFRGGSDLK